MEYREGYLLEALSGSATLLFDGAMGTMLQHDGILSPGQNPDLLNLEHPDTITDIHRAFVEAGSQVLTSNTFRSNRLKLGEDVSVSDIYRAAYGCAAAAGGLYIAGDIGPIGEMLEPYGDLSEEEALDIFAEQARAIGEAGYDLVLIETMTDLNEAVLAVRAALDNANLPVIATMSFEQNGFTMFGSDPASAAKALVDAGATCVGMNCSVGPSDAAGIVSAMREAVDVPIVCQPNAGLPRYEDNETIYDVAPSDFCNAMKAIVDSGVALVGGCCGTTPDFIRELRNIL